MKVAERQNYIIDRAMSAGFVSKVDVAAELGVSRIKPKAL